MSATFYVGDAVTVMNTLPEKSVDLILTSPPFLALRSYLPQDHPDKELEGGSQPTPGAYIDWLLDVVEACARVLAPHGSLCFELGDTYAGSMPLVRASSDTEEWVAKFGRRTHAAIPPTVVEKVGDAWPLAKSLSLIPETFRFAMVYGINPHTGRTTPPWRLRNVIRWVRPNPPVGALGDKFRPATSELMVFCKAKDRFFDLDAVREPHKREPDISNWTRQNTGSRRDDGVGFTAPISPAGAPPLDWWNIPLLDGDEETRYGKQEAPKEPKPRKRQDEPAMSRGGNWNTFPNVESSNPLGAPPLDWWEIPPGGYSGSHYAVFPEALCIKPIKAMCPEKVCRRCGEASRRVVGEAEYVNPRKDLPAVLHFREGERPSSEIPGEKVNQWKRVTGKDSVVRTVSDLGFSDCGHNDFRPGLVLDPFAGSGTTLSVATGHGRDAIGIDLDEKNYELALDRVGPLILQLGNVTPPT